jgi:flagellar protein FliO/FliZ
MVNRPLTTWAHKKAPGAARPDLGRLQSRAMFIADIARMVLGLAVTLGLIGLCVVALRRYGPETFKRLQGLQPGRERRLSIVETLVLDPARRLVLVRVDAEERLILLGEGRLIAAGAAPAAPALKAAPPANTAPEEA